MNRYLIEAVINVNGCSRSFYAVWGPVRLVVATLWGLDGVPYGVARQRRRRLRPHLRTIQNGRPALPRTLATIHLIQSKLTHKYMFLLYIYGA